MVAHANKVVSSTSFAFSVQRTVLLTRPLYSKRTQDNTTVGYKCWKTLCAPNFCLYTV